MNLLAAVSVLIEEGKQRKAQTSAETESLDVEFSYILKVGITLDIESLQFLILREIHHRALQIRLEKHAVAVLVDKVWEVTRSLGRGLQEVFVKGFGLEPANLL